VALALSGRVATADGTHPSALREMVIDVDRDIALDARGLPACHGPQHDIRRTLAQLARLCHDAIVGRGRADFEIAFPEQLAIRTASKVVVFNNTAKGKPVALVAAAEVDIPAPTIVSMSIDVSRAHVAGYGFRAVTKVPVIAGGSGSLLDFHLRIKRLFGHGRRTESLVTARCPDSVFKLSFPKLLFRNETHEPGVPPRTLMKGGLAIPCNPVG
jgi:hypothetical protein